MLIADSHEYIELYRGPRDLRVATEMTRQRDDVSVVSFAPRILSPADRAVLGARMLSDVELPEFPERFRLKTLPAITVRFSRSSGGGKFVLMSGYGRALAEARPDAIIESVYTWLTPRSHATMRAARRLGIPVIHYDPGDAVPVSTLQALALPFERPVMRDVSRVITFNGAGRRRFREKYDVPAERIRVIPKPIDVAQWRPRVDVGAVRDRLGLPRDAFVVASVGRLAPIKGSRVLADVAAMAERDPAASSWRFLFVGGVLGSDDDERLYARANTRVTGMLHNDEVPEIVAAADVIAFPDLAGRGGFWTTIAEAMAAAKPIVLGAAADQDFVPLVDGSTALFAAPADPDALCAALKRLERDPALRGRLGAAVGAYAAENMDYPAVARAWLAVVDEAIRERGSRGRER